MSVYGLPVVYALFVWWFSTGLIIYLDNLPNVTVRWSMTGATAVLAAALWGLSTSAADASVAGAYCAFTCGLLAWGWQEISFFTGALTGPRPLPCPEGCGPRRRFLYAVQACLYHELAIVVSAAAVYVVTRGGVNQVGFWTFMILWIMRQSAKLNVFLGVLNLNEEFLPEALGFLKSYFTRKPMNLLFPVSVAAATIVATMLVEKAAAAVSPAAATGFTFLSTLLILGILEHWFLVLPLPFAEIWSWSLRARPEALPAAAMPTWTARIDRPCDPAGLNDVLERVARGAFGKVDRVTGVVQAGGGWVQFYVADGHSRVAEMAQGEHDEACVVAFGRLVDKAGLQAAFAACSLPVAA
jgi:putative photosynthetic complex assembly protein 2